MLISIADEPPLKALSIFSVFVWRGRQVLPDQSARREQRGRGHELRRAGLRAAEVGRSSLRRGAPTARTPARENL
jgi:hypothetical protein